MKIKPRFRKKMSSGEYSEHGAYALSYLKCPKILKHKIYSQVSQNICPAREFHDEINIYFPVGKRESFGTHVRMHSLCKTFPFSFMPKKKKKKSVIHHYILCQHKKFCKEKHFCDMCKKTKKIMYKVILKTQNFPFCKAHKNSFSSQSVLCYQEMSCISEKLFGIF